MIWVLPIWARVLVRIAHPTVSRIKTLTVSGLNPGPDGRVLTVAEGDDSVEITLWRPPPGRRSDC
jgi:hypothetical protein